MSLTADVAIYFWGFLLLYGVAMYLASPRARTVSGFFHGTDARGRAASRWSLTASIFISWIFAKSVTNAANLGAAYGIVGGLAYATYWLSIPVAGLVIYRLRTRQGARSPVDFLVGRYGRLAGAAFTLAIVVRLYNEVWSNTAVVGSYFGRPGEISFMSAALVFTVLALFYSIKGGLRSSIVTDAIQAAVFVFFLALVVFLVMPKHGAVALLETGSFRLDAGVDLLLVASLQTVSYPFHDPVLTDRGFISEEKSMLRAFVIAGVVGFLGILTFSLVGVHARLEGLTVAGNAPLAVAHGLGAAALFVMTVVMMSSAGSTLDSAFASLAKSLAHDVAVLSPRRLGPPSVRTGIWIMAAFAVLGNLPMLAGTDILKATTISGTMVMGLAPVFLLHRWVRYSPWSFHLSFWSGLLLGLFLAADWIPSTWAIGEGEYALLLGTNAYGLLLCTAGFLLPVGLRAALARSPWRTRGVGSAERTGSGPRTTRQGVFNG